MRTDWILPVLGLVVFGLILFLPLEVKAGATTENQSAAALLVTAVVDFSINCSSVNLGTFAAGTSNGSASQECNMTVYSDTNTMTNISVNGTNFVNTTLGYALTMDNISFTNNSNRVGSCSTSLRSTFTSGWCSSAYNVTFNDWVMIPDPSVDITKNVTFNVNIPSYQSKARYTGYIYIKVTDIV